MFYDCLVAELFFMVIAAALYEVTNYNNTSHINFWTRTIIFYQNRVCHDSLAIASFHLFHTNTLHVF